MSWQHSPAFHGSPVPEDSLAACPQGLPLPQGSLGRTDQPATAHPHCAHGAKSLANLESLMGMLGPLPGLGECAWVAHKTRRRALRTLWQVRAQAGWRTRLRCLPATGGAQTAPAPQAVECAVAAALATRETLSGIASLRLETLIRGIKQSLAPKPLRVRTRRGNHAADPAAGGPGADQRLRGSRPRGALRAVSDARTGVAHAGSSAFDRSQPARGAVSPRNSPLLERDDYRRDAQGEDLPVRTPGARPSQ